MKEMVQRFIDILRERHSKDDLEMLLPGEFLQQTDLPSIVKIYQRLSRLLNPLTRGEMDVVFGYGTTTIEKSFLEQFAKLRNATSKRITTFDCLFLLRLQELVAKEDIQVKEEDERLLQLCRSTRDQWLEEIRGGQA